MSAASTDPELKKHHPFRRAVLRGLALVMPTLLTIVIFLWAWNAIENYVLRPLESSARYVIVWSIRDIHESIPKGAKPLETDDALGETFTYQGRQYVRYNLDEKKWIPQLVRDAVKKNPGEPSPRTADAYYHRYVKIRYLRRQFVLPFFLSLFILALYFLGKFLAAGMGRFLWNFGEGIIHRLPIIRTVYSSAKQVTDFVFSEQEVQYTRVVAVQYPRKGIWSIGFVTGESMKDIHDIAQEPVMSVLMPTSPMPATGFTITVAKSETIDLNLTIDQAIQFVVSCGVVVPLHQQSHHGKIASTVLDAIAQQPNSGEPKQTPPTNESDDSIAKP